MDERSNRMKRKITAALLAALPLAATWAQGTTVAAPQTAAWKYLAAALAVSVGAIAGGFAVARIGSAAMGAMAEKPELSGKALPYVGLAEGICLWGFLVALLILFV